MGAGQTTDELSALRASAAFEAERRLAWLRVGVMASGSVFFPLVVDRPDVIPWLGYAMLAVGWAYTVAVLAVEPYRRYPVLLSATFTTVTDSLMTLLWIVATGGVGSPWSVALMTVIVTLSFRHGPRYTALGTLLCAAGYVGAGAALGQLSGHGIDVAVQVFFLFVVSAGGALVAHDRQRELASRVRLLDLAEEIAQVGSWEWSVETGELRWSESLRRIFGLGPEVTPTFQTYVDAIVPEDRDVVVSTIQQAREDLKPFRMDHRIVRPDGTTRWLHCRGRVLVGSDGRAGEMLGSAQDVTERREMESQLVLSSKLASLGTLASGIAHEINNPLAYVANNLDLLERRLEDEVEGCMSCSELREVVAAARHGSNRVRDIVRGLRTFSRAEEQTLASVDVPAVADLAIVMVLHEVEHKARLVRTYEACPRVAANESRLSQVLVNLLVNAAQAIEPGAPEANEVRLRVRRADDGRVAIEVSDTGAGIAEPHLPRIFDPFFTTKPIGVGNGLGLAICHGIVREMSGEIEVETEVGVGTTFRVLLPAASDAVPGAPAPPASGPPEPTVERPRVLLVDDEVRFATSLAMLLEPAYEVVTCHDGGTALARLESGERYDVILCDLMMPDMTGMSLYARLAARGGADQTRAIFLTGGATNEEARAFLERADVRHLVKPVTPAELEAQMAAVLAASRSVAA